jgi:aspartate/methionine/tyrosine aminotransferase
VGAPAPLQEGVAAGLEELGQEYYDTLSSSYRARRDLLCDGLVAAGFKCEPPAGAYYVMAEFSDVKDFPSDTEFAGWLTREVGVAPVPGSSFFNSAGGGKNLVRFAFCKTQELLEEAVDRLRV